MSDHNFCRMLLKTVRSGLTAEQKRRLTGAWAYMYDNNHGEFHVPSDDFYWHGSADCKYNARAEGIQAWLDKYYPDHDQEGG